MRLILTCSMFHERKTRPNLLERFEGNTALLGRRAGMQQGAMVAHHEHQRTTNILCHEGKQDGGDDSPNDKRVPFPLPDRLDEAHGVVAEMFHLMFVERKLARMKDVHTELDEWNEEQDVQRRDKVRSDLRGDLA